MSELLEGLRALTEQIILTLGYPGLALIMFVETVFPPIPSEVVLPFAGSLVGEGTLSLLGVMVSSTLGAVLGTLPFYYLGRVLGEARTRAFVGRFGRWFGISEEDFERSLKLFRRFDRHIVFFARLLPGARSVISLPAGVAHMPLVPFLAYTTLGTVLWNLLLSLSGILLGRNWDRILHFVDRYELLVWSALVLAVAWFATRRVRELRRARQ